MTACGGTSFPLEAALVRFHLQDQPLPFDPALEDELEAADRLTDA